MASWGTSGNTSLKPRAPRTAWGGGYSNSIQTGATAALKPQAPATGAPAVAAATPAATAAPKAPTPFDSQWSTGIAGLLFNNKNQRDDLTRQGAQADQDFNTMLSRMADQRAQDLLAQNYAANKQGLFYSGQLGKRRDSVDKEYSQRETDARTSKTRDDEARATALERLGTIIADAASPTGFSATGQAGLTLADLLGQAVGRQTAANAPLAEGVAATQVADPAPAPAAAEAAPVITSAGPQATTGGNIVIRPSASHGGAKWIYRVGSSGALIPIRPA